MKSVADRIYIVLPEAFGVNARVRSVAHGHPALALPLFARTAPDLGLTYETSDLAQGRRNKDATSADQILSDLAVAFAWLGSITRRPPSCGGLLHRGACRLLGGHPARGGGHR